MLEVAGDLRATYDAEEGGVNIDAKAAIGGETTRVRRRLNAGRAMTLCWRANTASSARFTSKATRAGRGRARSRVKSLGPLRAQAAKSSELKYSPSGV